MSKVQIKRADIEDMKNQRRNAMLKYLVSYVVHNDIEKATQILLKSKTNALLEEDERMLYLNSDTKMVYILSLELANNTKMWSRAIRPIAF